MIYACLVQYIQPELLYQLIAYSSNTQTLKQAWLIVVLYNYKMQTDDSSIPLFD